jgi:endonuclease/exonuclease/phosphatase family metal-dependent hydrolase
MTVTLCTFNVNNLFLRYRFGGTYPGNMSGASGSEFPKWGYLPLCEPGLFQEFSPQQREIAALALRNGANKLPDIVCVQEVESLLALRTFNELHLGGYYKFAALIDSRDMRQIDVGVLSIYPISSIRSNVDLPDPNDGGYPWIFSRDCLELAFDFNKSGSRRLSVFVNHFKSKLVTGATPAALKSATQRALEKRRSQATQVLQLLHERFPGTRYDTASFAVVGDLNDEPTSAAIRPLIEDGRLENAVDRLPATERWTHFYKSKGQVSQFDYLLLSPKLSASSAGTMPFIQRGGIGFREASKKDGAPLPAQAKLVKGDDDANPVAIDFRFKRFDTVSADLAASDHCPVSIELPV